MGTRLRPRLLIVAAIAVALVATACDMTTNDTTMRLPPSAPAAGYGTNDAVECRFRDPATNANVTTGLTVFTPSSDVPIPTYEPSGKRPAIVYFHGGGWVEGGRAGLDTTILYAVRGGGSIKAQLDHGFVVVSADYRLSGVAAFPAQITDALAAINCTKALPSTILGGVTIDPARVFAAGSSAGGHLASLVTLSPVTPAGWEPTAAVSAPAPPAGTTAVSGAPTTGPRTLVRGGVNLDGPTDLTRFQADASVDPNLDTQATAGLTYRQLGEKLLCGPTIPSSSSPAELHDRAVAASPITYVVRSNFTTAPHMYLACGSSANMPLPFQNCSDHNAAYQKAYQELNGVSGGLLAIDRTGNPTVAVHTNIDVYLNYVKLSEYLTQ
jgi:hypothetical protein